MTWFWLILKWISAAVVLAAGVAGLFENPYHDDPATGKRTIKKAGWITLAGLLVGGLLFIATEIKERYESAEKDRIQRETSAKLEHMEKGQEKNIHLSEDIIKSQREQLAKSKELTEAQQVQLAKSEELTEAQKEQLTFLRSLVESQEKQAKLSGQLTAQQREQVQHLRQMRLDRELIGVEISFRPSADHWSRIAYACDKITPASPGFPYSGAIITAERVGRYWDIDFSEISQKQGSVRPPPISTESPDGKPFNEVIDTAMVELVIYWGGLGKDVELFLSARGNYPSAIKISKELITLTFRPPKLRQNLGDLHDNPTVTIRGQQYPAYLRFRSLDYRVKFDEVINLDWVKKTGNTHTEKWMPYISGPYRLNIDWSQILN